MSTTIEAKAQLNPDNLEMRFETRFGSEIKYYDDGFGPFWIYQDASGLLGVVRAQTWNDAWEIVEDEFLPVVSPEDIHEAYGFDNREEFDRVVARCDRGEINHPELSEGYSYQSNATGTGVVMHDLNGEKLDPLTTELADRLEIKIVVKM